MSLPLNILCFFVSFLPLFLIIGPAPTNIAVCIIDLLLLYIVFRNKEFRIFNNFYFKSFLLLCCLFIISSLVSNYKIFSLSVSFFYFRYGLLALSIIYLSEKLIYFPKYFLLVLTIVFIFLIIDSYFQFFTGNNFFGYEYNGLRLSSVFGKEKILGSYFSRLFPIFFGLLILNYKNLKIPIYFGLFSLILIDVLIYLSGERTAFFYLILFSVLVIILLKNWRYIRLIALVFSIILITIMSYLQPNLKERMLDQTINQTKIFEDKVHLFSYEHESIYKIALDIFSKNPIIGIGPKNFRIECQKKEYSYVDGCRSHPHNTYIQLLVETGIIGFIAIFSFFIIVVFKLIKQFYSIYFSSFKYMNNYDVCFSLAVLINLWPLIPTGNFFSSYLSVFYFLSFGFYFSKFKHN